MHSTIARKMTDLQFGRCMLIPHVVPVAEEEEEEVLGLVLAVALALYKPQQ